MLDPYFLMTRSLWDQFPIFGQALIIGLGHPRLTRPSRAQPGYLEDLRSTEVSPNCSCETRMDREEVNGAFFSPWAMGCSHGEKGDMFKWDVWGFGKIWGFHLENGYLMVYIYVYIYGGYNGDQWR